MGYLLTILARMCETAIVAVGAHLSITVSGIFFLGIPSMISLGTYGLMVPQRFGVSMPLSIGISFFLTFIGSLIFVQLYRRLSNDSFTVFSLTSLLAIEACILSLDALTGGPLGISGISRPAFTPTLSSLLTIHASLAVLVIGTEYILLKTWFGRALRGIKENETVVATLKISPQSIGGTVIILCCVFSMVHGILLVWRIQFLDVNFGSLLVLIHVLTVAIVAIKPHIRWVIVSVIFITLLPEALRYIEFPAGSLGHIRNILYSSILITVVYYLNAKHSATKRTL